MEAHHDRTTGDAVADLAAGVAHYFNNVLLAVRGYAELIAWEASSPVAVKSFAEQITAACEQATALTRQLQLFGRRDALMPEQLDLNAVVVSARPLLAPLIGDGVQLELELGSGLPPVQVDRAHLEAALVNLVLNATLAMPAGGTIRIATSAVIVDAGAGLAAGSYGRLDIHDSGDGLDAETRSRVFEPFAVAHVGDDAGLGLPAVHAFARQSGGGATVQSEAGHGTCITVYLPADPAVAAAPVVRHAA